MSISGKIELNGGSGGGDPSGGGGVPGTGTGSSLVTTGLPIGENGGVIASTFLLFMPVQDVVSKRSYIAFFDINSFDDSLDGSSYSYRQEDVMLHKVPTVNRVRLIYRDLGLAVITVKLKAVNDNDQIVTSTVSVQLGNKIATNELFTRIVDISLTGYRPQLSIIRDAGAGPVCITAATIEGTVEE